MSWLISPNKITIKYQVGINAIMEVKGTKRGRRTLSMEGTVEQRPNETSFEAIWWKSIEAAGTAGAKALRQGHTCVFED